MTLATSLKSRVAVADAGPPAALETKAVVPAARGQSPGLRIVWYRSGEMLQFGGGERVLLEGLRSLTDLGADVRLLLHEPPTSPTGAWFAERYRKVEWLPGFSVGAPEGPAAARFVRRVRTLARMLRSIAPDVVVAESPVEARFLWLYSLGGRLRLPPVATFIHGSPFQFADDATKYARVFRPHFADIRKNDPVYREMIPADPPPMPAATRLRLDLECAVVRAGVRMSARLFVLSQKNRAEVARLYGVDEGKAIVAAPGGFARSAIVPAATRANPRNDANAANAVDTVDAVDAVEGGSPPFRDLTRPLVLSVCRLIAKKRVDLLIRAFRVLADRDPASTATLVIGGAGPEEPALRALAASLRLERRVRFIGFIPEAELAGWYRAADVFVSADNADYDLTVMAALPAGKNVVVSTQYDVPAGLTALRRHFFVAQPSAAGYAQAIASALASPAPATAAGEAGQRELDALCWESYFGVIHEQLQSAAAEAAQRQRTHA